MENVNTRYPTPYPDLNIVLRELVESVHTALGDNFVAACLQGSFAVGDFDRYSDVDFIIAIEEELSKKQIQDLQALHERVYNLEPEWAQHLEGSYIPKDVLRRHDQTGKKLWYLDHGARSLIRSDHCNTLIVRWVVREKGVALAGPSPASLVDPIPVELLRREILATINDWGHEILADPDQFNNRFYQGFLVLNYCRMLHDHHTGSPASKHEGAEWAKVTLDPSWSGLIDRAWSGRPNPALSVRQPADPDEFSRTLALIEYVIEKSLQYAATLESGATSES